MTQAAEPPDDNTIQAAEPIDGQTIAGDDWYGEQIAGRTYLNCTLSQVDLTESVIQNCTFTACTFRDVRFNAARVISSALTNCSFGGCNFFDAEFTDCKMTGSSFQRCGTRPLRVLGGDWSFVSLPGADLRGASFQNVRMREADLTGANCVGSVFSAVDLSAAMLHRVQFTRADLRGSDLSSLDPLVVELREAIISAEQAVGIAQALGLVVHRSSLERESEARGVPRRQVRREHRIGPPDGP